MRPCAAILHSLLALQLQRHHTGCLVPFFVLLFRAACITVYDVEAAWAYLSKHAPGLNMALSSGRHQSGAMPTSPATALGGAMELAAEQGVDLSPLSLEQLAAAVAATKPRAPVWSWGPVALVRPRPVPGTGPTCWGQQQFYDVSWVLVRKRAAGEVWQVSCSRAIDAEHAKQTHTCSEHAAEARKQDKMTTWVPQCQVHSTMTCTATSMPAHAYLVAGMHWWQPLLFGLPADTCIPLAVAGCVPFSVQVSRPEAGQVSYTAAAGLGPGAYEPCYTQTERQTALQVLSFLHMLGRQDLVAAHQSSDAGDTSSGTGVDLVTATDAWLRPRTKGYVDMHKALSREAAEQLQAGSRLLTSQIPLPDADLGDVVRPRVPQVHIVETDLAEAGGCLQFQHVIMATGMSFAEQLVAGPVLLARSSTVCGGDLMAPAAAEVPADTGRRVHDTENLCLLWHAHDLLQVNIVGTHPASA